VRYILAFLLFGPLSAFADDWTLPQYSLGAVALAATVVDYGQTRWIAENCHEPIRKGCYGEVNPILGRHPSIGKVNAYFAIVPATQYLIADGLLSGTRRTAFLGVIAGLEIAVTAHNAKVGYRMSF
jgi:hypothetical protein